MAQAGSVWGAELLVTFSEGVQVSTNDIAITDDLGSPVGLKSLGYHIPRNELTLLVLNLETNTILI